MKHSKIKTYSFDELVWVFLLEVPNSFLFLLYSSNSFASASPLPSGPFSLSSLTFFLPWSLSSVASLSSFPPLLPSFMETNPRQSYRACGLNWEGVGHFLTNYYLFSKSMLPSKSPSTTVSQWLYSPIQNQRANIWRKSDSSLWVPYLLLTPDSCLF